LPRTVLLADDSVTAQNMGRRILTDAGYEVITVNNGSAALKKIHESRPDLIVLDVYMPGYGGLEICQRLKESEATMKIPVLLTVGKMEPFKTDEAKRVRADGHIVKPFDASELLAALTKLEDRIIPKSENGRGKGKSENKRSKALSGRDPLTEADESRTDQISYLKQRKERQATTPKQQVAAEESEVAKSQEPADDAVTFASGPIFDPKAWTAAEKSAPEFPVEKAIETEQATASSQEPVATPAASETAVSDSIASIEQASVDSASAKQSAPTEAEPASAVPSGPRWVAENVETTAEEASRSLDEEMRHAQAAEEPATSEPPVSDSTTDEPSRPVETSGVAAPSEISASVISDEKSNETVPEAESAGAAFAAAASASASSAPVDAFASSPELPEAAPSSEAAASSNQWERIRDSVVNQQTTEALAQSATAMVESAQVQSEPASQEATESSKTAASEATSSQQPAGGDALSSIVDTVLAELKPRLLAEIAKQIAADKK